MKKSLMRDNIWMIDSELLISKNIGLKINNCFIKVKFWKKYCFDLKYLTTIWMT
jgi:hypothetical protein